MQLRVLVVEDHDDTRELIAEALRMDGHVVVQARTGMEALHMFTSLVAANLAPDVIVTDLWMPGMRGLSLIACIRAAGWTCPAILITAHDHPDVRAQARAMDVMTFIKPLDVDALCRVVASRAHAGA
jgi:CheY-like chemotaxis protein